MDYVFIFYVYFLTEFPYVTQAGPELSILLSQRPEWWNDRHYHHAQLIMNY
jgi:hypothetical protein